VDALSAGPAAQQSRVLLQTPQAGVAHRLFLREQEDVRAQPSLRERHRKLPERLGGAAGGGQQQRVGCCQADARARAAGEETDTAAGEVLQGEAEQQQDGEGERATAPEPAEEDRR